MSENVRLENLILAWSQSDDPLIAQAVLSANADRGNHEPSAVVKVACHRLRAKGRREDAAQLHAEAQLIRQS
jgi:hypothetical protein